MAEKVLATCVVVFMLCLLIIKIFPKVPDPPRWWHGVVIVAFLSSGGIFFVDVIYLIWR